MGLTLSSTYDSLVHPNLAKPSPHVCAAMLTLCCLIYRYFDILYVFGDVLDTSLVNNIILNNIMFFHFSGRFADNDFIHSS